MIVGEHIKLALKIIFLIQLVANFQIMMGILKLFIEINKNKKLY